MSPLALLHPLASVLFSAQVSGAITGRRLPVQGR
jgi:hypothetical protein